MKDYTIYVTEEIAKKAMEKGFVLDIMTKEDKIQEIKNKIFDIRLEYYELMRYQPEDFHISLEEYNKKADELRLDEVHRFQDYEDINCYDGEWEKHAMVECFNFDDYSWMKK